MIPAGELLSQVPTIKPMAHLLDVGRLVSAGQVEGRHRRPLHPFKVPGIANLPGLPLVSVAWGVASLADPVDELGDPAVADRLFEGFGGKATILDDTYPLTPPQQWGKRTPAPI